MSKRVKVFKDGGTEEFEVGKDNVHEIRGFKENGISIEFEYRCEHCDQNYYRRKSFANIEYEVIEGDIGKGMCL